MNTGMISGCVVRIEDKSSQAGFPAALVTIAGETWRSSKALVYFEQIRLTGSVAIDALKLKDGEAVMFDQAVVEQQTWVDTPSGEPRARIVTRGLSLARLRGISTRVIQGYPVLEQAVNAFWIRGRLANASATKGIAGTQVTEVSIVVNLPEGRGRDTRPHYLKVEQWGATPLKGQAKGVLCCCEALIKTDSKVIAGMKRHFTGLEARSAAVLA